jgi:hypothetical protein
MVVPPGGATDAIVVDLGGPGIALLAGGSNLGELAAEVPALGERFSFVFIEEPWVTEPLDDRCRESLRNFYAAARDVAADAPSHAAGLVDACDVGDRTRRWGHDAERYASAVEEIARRERLDIRGFVGQSFGDVRASYLAPGTYDWSVFLRPFPLDVNGESLLGERATLATAMAERLAAEGRFTSGPGDLGSFDLASAVLGLGYLSPGDLERLAPGVLSGADRASIRSLSDRVWQVYGDGDVSPAYLAYLDEVCAAATRWPVYEPGTTSVANVLAAAHLPCAAIDPPPGGSREDNALTRDRSCAVVSPADPISPASLVTADTLVTVDAVEHQSIAGLDECLRRVRAVG